MLPFQPFVNEVSKKSILITRCDFVAYGQEMQKTLQRFLCSKKRDKKSLCKECVSFAN
jgi:hypothetical protein